MANLFQNPTSPLESLPPIDEDEFEPMPARYRRQRWTVFAVVVCLGIGVLCAPIVWLALQEEVIPDPVWGMLIAMGLISLLWAVEEFRGFPVRGVLLRERDLTFRSGFWVRETVTVPFNRIQHSEVSQGPLARAFGVCTLKLYTAGSSGANLRVPGLDFERAQELRAYLDERAGKS